MEETRELQDWDLLPPTSDPQTHLPPPLDIPKDFVEIGVSEGTIRADYFSSDPQQQYGDRVGELDDEMGSVSSDNPSWIEPSSESARKRSTEFWSDTSSEGHDSHKFVNFEGNQYLGMGDYGKIQVGSEDVREIGEFGNFWSDSGGEEDKREGVVQNQEEKKIRAENLGAGEGVIGENMVSVSSGEEKKGIVWWKLPFEIMKFCLFKVNPGWSIAVAAAVMGIVILKRRLYRMKKKSRGVPLNITVEDKTVSQFMKNAARLNEAFSVVRRVPMVRPLLPSTGLTPWPVVNLR